MASLSLKNVCKVYPNGFVAVKDFNLEIADQEFIIFVGPSGCGKSTTLRMIAGLEEISSGELWIGDKMVNDVEPKDRDIAMVFQNYALYPHMSVYDNMAFGLKLRKVPKAEIDNLHGHRKQTFQSADFLFRVCHDLFAILMVHRKCHDGIHGKSGGFVAIFLFRLGKHLLCLFSFFRAASQYKYRCQHKGCCFFPIHVCSFSFCMTCSNFILHSKKLPVK